MDIFWFIFWEHCLWKNFSYCTVDSLITISISNHWWIKCKWTKNVHTKIKCNWNWTGKIMFKIKIDALNLDVWIVYLECHFSNGVNWTWSFGGQSGKWYHFNHVVRFIYKNCSYHKMCDSFRATIHSMAILLFLSLNNVLSFIEERWCFNLNFHFHFYEKNVLNGIFMFHISISVYVIQLMVFWVRITHTHTQRHTICQLTINRPFNIITESILCFGQQHTNQINHIKSVGKWHGLFIFGRFFSSSSFSLASSRNYA